MNNKHELESTLTNLKDFRKSLSEFLTPPSESGWHLYNLPTHFWETLGECINNIEEFIKPLPSNYSIPIYENGIKTEWSVDGIIGDEKYFELIKLGNGKGLPIMINTKTKK